MHKSTLFFCGALVTVALSWNAAAAEAIDFNDGPEHTRTEVVRIVRQPVGTAPVGFYPTLRYYTKHGVMAYNFVPVDRVRARRISPADPFLLSADSVPSSGTATRMIVGGHHVAFRETRVVTPLTPLPPVQPSSAPTENTAPTAPAPIPPTTAPADAAPAEGAK